ncbi:MAG: tRNA adenosine(34) deaminase TadA [Planctomycetaceae bacterium]|jgi:tRNA(adenine34) deaminase|nr:tRNA adenosine(34) deaminase TadA [Planctomycetaceae bacterium]
MHDHEYFMRFAIIEAQTAAAEDEVPVGAVIVHNNQIIAAAHNQREQLKDPTAHAEIIAITQATNHFKSWRLEDCTIYVTLEPCIMCAGAILQARIDTVVYGTNDPKSGAVKSLFELLNDTRLNHHCNIIPNILTEQCSTILTKFFKKKRENKSSIRDWEFGIEDQKI